MIRFLGVAGLGIAMASAWIPAWAQYPAKPVRLIVTTVAGGPGDSAARVVGQALSQSMGQPVLIENKPGADGAIAAQVVLNSPPDGYTLFWGNANALVGVPLLNKTPPYDPASFTPVSFIGRLTLFLYSHAGVPAKTVTDLVGHSRANPGKLNCATVTFSDVVALAQFTKAAGVSITRVPYKGAAQALPDLAAGNVQIAVLPAFPGLAYVREGRLRALAVFLPQRSTVAPEVPTMAEAGIAGVSTPWNAVFGPPKMPREIAERLSGELNRALKQPAVQSQFDMQAYLGEGSTPQALAAYLRDDLEKSKVLVRELGITRQ